MKTVIKRWGINGEGIGYVRRKPVFIEGVLPNEEVEFHIVEDKEKYLIGELDRIVSKSSKRRYPLCSKWKECGGCALMHVQYKAQAKMKEQLVREALRKYAKYTKPILPILKNENSLSYRNSCKMPFGYEKGHLMTGMYEKESRSFVGIERCFVHSRLLEQVRQNINNLVNEFGCKLYDEKEAEGLRSLVLKEFDGRIQVIFVTGNGVLPQTLVETISKLDVVSSIWQSIKTDSSIYVFGETMVHLYGEEKMSIQVGELTCSLLPKSFFQLNTMQAIRLYQLVNEWVPKSKHIVEAYCGIGAMSLMVSHKADKVTGIEYVEDAIINAKQNATENFCDNVEFICGDAATELNQLHERVDTLIVDPPRRGLDRAMKDAILHSDIETMVYVSCNPSTLAKDLAVLSKKYQIEKVQPIDMFSQTPHVETVCLLINQNARAKHHVNVGLDAEDYYKIKNGK